MRQKFVLLFILLGVLVVVFHPKEINAQQQSCSEIGTYQCYSFNCYSTTSQKYEYDTFQCTITQGAQGCNASSSLSSRSHTSSQQSNTNMSPQGSTICNQYAPGGCNQGYYGNNTPTCIGEGGGSGGCPGGGNYAGTCLRPQRCGNCGQFTGLCCSQIPLACRSELAGCSGGGSPTATPTPTPAPGCTLSCPGTEVNLGGGFGGGLGGNIGAGGSNDRYFTAEAGTSGRISYLGEPGFTCSKFVDGVQYDGDCPRPTYVTPTPIGGGGGAGVQGVSTIRRVHGESLFVKGLRSLAQMGPFKEIGKVLGTETLLAQNVGGNLGGGLGGGSNGTEYSSWNWPVEYRYLNGSTPKTYKALASESQIAGGVSNPVTLGQSCSCSVVLSCPLTVSDINDDTSILSGCNSDCNVSANPSRPQAGVSARYTITHSADYVDVTVDYGDGTIETYDDSASSFTINHTYTNAGVYPQLAVSCRNNAGTETKSCARKVTAYCDTTDPYDLPTPTATLTPTPSPSPTPGPWMKMKDTSFNIQQDPGSAVPVGALQYDTTDVGLCEVGQPSNYACFSSGEAGAVMVKGGSPDFGAGLSQRNWLRADSAYDFNATLTPAAYVSYVKARKDYKTVTALDAQQFEAGRINYIIPDPGVEIVSDDTIPNLIPNGSGAVIIVQGDLAIDLRSGNGIFNTDNKAIAFVVTGTLQIASSVQELNGIFIANDVQYAYDTTTTDHPLKINGNISIVNAPVEKCNDVRQRTDTVLKPSCFVTMDFQNQYVPLIDLLSTRTYNWSELEP